MRWLAVVVLATALVAACGSDDNDQKGTPSVTRSVAPAATDDGGAETLTVESDAFDPGAAIPERFSCEGDNVSPQLAWSDSPEGTQAVVLVMDDPDAPGGTFTHWLLYDLSPETVNLPENVETGERPGVGGVQGTNDGNRLGYTGPCPPPGQTHNYAFTVYALDSETGLDPGASAAQVHGAIEGHVVAQGELTGAFGR
jgi:hypothetical protein